ncbi:hypothetical protein LguiA_013591 [Lonicera macranthoides]
MAEANAIKMAIEFGSLLPFSQVIIESECKVVIDAIRGSSSFVEWDSIGILDDIALVACVFEAIEFAFAPRPLVLLIELHIGLLFMRRMPILPKDWFSNIPLQMSNILVSIHICTYFSINRYSFLLFSNFSYSFTLF